MSNTASQLRALASRLRTTSMPLADIIPTLQRAADELDRAGASRATQANTILDLRMRLTVTRASLQNLLATIHTYDDGELYLGDDAATQIASAERVAAMPEIEQHVIALQGQQAIDHLHALLNTQRTATQALEAERAARDWLDSIGSEPR